MKKIMKVIGIGAVVILLSMILMPVCAAEDTATVTGKITSYTLNEPGYMTSFVVNEVTININHEQITQQQWDRLTDRIIRIYERQDTVIVKYKVDGNELLSITVVSNSGPNRQALNQAEGCLLQ